MSSEIQFYKSEIATEKFAKLVGSEDVPLFSEEDIYRALKSLFEGKERVSKEYVEALFESVELDGLLTLSDNDLENIDPQFSDNLKYLFDREKQPFSFVDKKLWQNLEKIIVGKILEAASYNNESNENNESYKERLDNINYIIKDYIRLKELFQQKNLFIAVC